MKKYLSLLIAAVVAIGGSAENYGITISGTEITDANCNNVTNGYVGAYDITKPHSIKYDPKSKTLTLQNIKIERAGIDNRAIRNYGCDGLTIVFDGRGRLSATQSAPVRLEKNTTITTTNVTNSYDIDIIGRDEDGIYITNGSTLTFYNAAIRIFLSGNSSCIEGKTGNEKLIISGSVLNIDIYEKADEAYSLRDIGSIFVENSFVSFPNRVKNVENVTLGTNAYFKPEKRPDGDYEEVTFKRGKFIFDYNTALALESVTISTGIPIDAAHFPDFYFRFYLSWRPYGEDYFIDCYYPMQLKDFNDELEYITEMDNSDGSITSLEGISYFKHLKTLRCNTNKLTELDLSALDELTYLDCTDNRLTSIKVSTSAQNLRYIYCDGNNLTDSGMTEFMQSLPTASKGEIRVVNHLNTNEKNRFTSAHAALAKKKGWIARHISTSSGDAWGTNGCEPIDLWLGGNRLFNCMNVDDVGRGYTYDSTDKTLYLTSKANITGTTTSGDLPNGCAIYSKMDGLTIYVDGVINAYAADNENYYGIDLNTGSTTFTGTGQLYCNGKVGLHIMNNNVVVEGDVTLQGMGTSCGIYNESFPSSITVKGNAKLNAYTSRSSSPYSAIYGCFYLFKLQDRHCITAPVGAYWYFNEDEEVSYVANSAGKKIVGDLVMIAPAQKADVNLDGSVNTADVVAVYNFIESGNTSGFTREDANVNSDNDINTADVVAIYDYIMNGK